ncbi:MAG: hypothetical protein HZB22_00940 [Deltaproteobacteria bacterium]|nr:hypothetical protein [Deltaproteobacteria bacterium]
MDTSVHVEDSPRLGPRGIFKRPLAVLLYIFMALLWRSVAVADDASVVRSEGVVSGADAGAGGDVREMALQSAIKNAVGSALDLLMKRESIPEDPAITQSVYENPMNYVLNYRVVSEGWSAPAEQAAVPEGRQAQGAQKDQPVQKALQPQNNQQAQQGQPAQKDQTTETSSSAPPVNTGEYRAEVEVSVDAVRLRALVSAAISGGGTAEVAVNIVDITDYGAYRSILDSLGRIALIKEISYGSFSRGRITLSVKTAASSGTLLERIVKEVGDRYSVEPGGSRTIIIRPLRTAPGQTGKLT